MVQDVWQAGFEQRLSTLVNTDAQVRDRMPDPDVAASVAQPGLSLAQIVDAVMRGYAHREAVKERKILSSANGSPQLSTEHATLTYQRLWANARAAASAWHHSFSGGPRSGEMICSIGVGSINYATLELACIAAGVVSVPLITNSTQAQWQSIIGETRPTALAIDLEFLDSAATAILNSEIRPKTVYILDLRRGDAAGQRTYEQVAARLRTAGIDAEPFQDLVFRGSTLPPRPLPSPSSDAPALAQIIYTSGATGTPKGAMFTTAHLAAMWFGQAQAKMPTVVTHYMPMSHVAGRMVLTGALARGGTCYFSTGTDPARMWEDLALSRPTEFFLIPRVCEMIFDRYRRIVASAVENGTEQSEAEEDARTHLREDLLGGRIVSAVNGSAPLDLNLHSFMESLLAVPVHDAYGSTEAGGVVMFDNLIQRPPVIEYKLVDVPELGYHSTDRPYPRGELLLKTVSMVPGYFNRPDLNDEILDADGYYRTGDVMAETGPDELQFVERRNNVLKLSQAEFVAVSKLEAIYAGIPEIQQIFIYGRSGRSSLVAVIVPEGTSLLTHDESHLRKRLVRAMQSVAKSEGLHPYEIPRDFIIESTPFSAANGLLSGVAKPLRPKLHDRYTTQLEQLYRDLDATREAELKAMHRDARDRPVLETVQRATHALLGTGDGLLPADANFAELGGDSMAAYELATQLVDLFNLEVPVSVILSPANGLREIAAYIETERDAGSPRITASTVHADRTRIVADELTLDRLIDPDHLVTARSLAPANGPRVYLLTGANGYLGRFLALDLLKRANEDGSRVICLVRGSDAAAARRRLDAVLSDGDPNLLAKYRELAAGRLEVLAGDISQPHLGLSEADWTRLAADVTAIFHPGALVNHVLPYHQLFGPNVAGTAELIKLATTTNIKQFVYLSTVGIADQIPPKEFSETGDIRTMCPVRSVSDSYANGYANTKWASEVLLRHAHDECAVPVTIFRSNMILAHTQYAGQLNLPDMFTRLVFSVLATGIAPESFYLPTADDGRKRTHFDGLPVDFTAESIVTLASKFGHHTYNLVNPNDDGVSLDTFVDWLIASGHPIERIADYSDWIHRLELGLRGLPDHLGRHSLLPLLHAFQVPEQLPDIIPPAEHFRATVAQAGVAGGRIPSIQPELIDKYVTDLRIAGLLAWPE